MGCRIAIAGSLWKTIGIAIVFGLGSSYLLTILGQRVVAGAGAGAGAGELLRYIKVRIMKSI
jgi:hypothetical protein